MIYLKKSNGTIQLFEDSMGHALDIDREIQGEKFGEIYTAESLPDDDKLKLKLITQTEIDAKAILNRIAEIKSELTDIDTRTIRPLRATVSGVETVDDIKMLSNLEANASALRDKLKQLKI